MNARKDGSSLQTDGHERTIADVVKDATSNIQDLIRSEVQLARIELKEEFTKAKASGALFGIGAALGLFGTGFCLLAIMYALGLVLPAWAAAVVVGVVLMMGAGIAIVSARGVLKKLKPPSKTIFTVREDLEWIRNQSRS